MLPVASLLILGLCVHSSSQQAVPLQYLPSAQSTPAGNNGRAGFGGYPQGLGSQGLTNQYHGFPATFPNTGFSGFPSQIPMAYFSALMQQFKPQKPPMQLTCKRVEVKQTDYGSKVTAIAATITDKHEAGYGMFSSLFSKHGGSGGGLHLDLDLMIEGLHDPQEVKVVFTSATDMSCDRYLLGPIFTWKNDVFGLGGQHGPFFGYGGYGKYSDGTSGVVGKVMVYPATISTLNTDVDAISVDDIKGRGLAVVKSIKTGMDGKPEMDGEVVACCGLAFSKISQDLKHYKSAPPQSYPVPQHAQGYPSPPVATGYPQPPVAGHPASADANPQPPSWSPSDGGYPQPKGRYPPPQQQAYTQPPQEAYRQLPPQAYPQPPQQAYRQPPPQDYPQPPQQAYPQAPPQGYPQPPPGGYPAPQRYRQG